LIFITTIFGKKGQPVVKF